MKMKTVDNFELDHRYAYHAPSGRARTLHEGTRKKFGDMARWLNDNLPEGRSKDNALDILESASFHAQAAIARDRNLHED